MKKDNWYYNRDLKPQGPVNTEELRLKIYRGEIGPRDLIFSEAEDVWRSASEWKNFETSLFPARQKVEFMEDLAQDKREWVVLIDSKQEGPFSVGHIQKLINEGMLVPQQLIWKSGLSGWCQLQDRPEFSMCFSSERL